MKSANAEKVKDGSGWYENKPVSYIINRLLELVYRDNDGYLPDTRRLSRELIKIPTLDKKLGYWGLGVPPNWDGSSFTPSETAFPVTSICTNEAKNFLYVGLGGVDGINPGELWQYDISNNIWTFLAKTGTVSPTNNLNNVGLHNLVYNTNDGLIYGALWIDKGDTQSSVEDAANKINWFAPEARIFWWDPENPGTDSGPYLNDNTYSLSIGNIWPGEWDIREMYRHDSAAEMGIKKDGGPGPTSQGADLNEVNTYKLDAKASVGNFNAFKYISVPFGPVGQQGFGNDGEPRRTAHKYHPQPATNSVAWEADPLMQTWGNTLYGTAKGELIPTTSNGDTAWTNATGTTAPDGWIRAGTAQFSVGGADNLVITNANQTTSGLNLTLSGIEDNMTIYRLRIEGGLNYELFVSNSAHGTNSIPYGPLGPVNSVGYSNTYYGNGDYYFGVLSTNSIDNPNWASNDNLYLSLRRRSASGNIEMNNISLTVARYWDKWHSLSKQAGENIPLTSYSKIIAGATIKYPTHGISGAIRDPDIAIGPQEEIAYYTADEGPDFELYDSDVPSNPNAVPDPALTYAGKKRNEEIFLDFNLVAQDRRLLPGADWTTAAYHPMYGPSEAEDGISPDNSKRFVVGGRNLSTPATYNSSTYSNEARIVDMGPRVGNTNNPGAWTGVDAFYSDTNTMQTGKTGHGYASVQLQAIGERAMDATISDDYALSGIVRYTNGQQGFFTFSQEADNGKGVIMFAAFDGDIPLDAQQFNWGPNSGSGNRFEIKYRAFKCNGGSSQSLLDFPSAESGTGVGTIKTRRDIGSFAPYLTGGENWVPVYPTAGCTDNQGNFYIGSIESFSQTALYTGSNESSIYAKSYIIKVALGTGSFSIAGSSSSLLYTSGSDASVYNTDGVGGCWGRLSNDWNLASAESSSINNTRKICWLHFNPYMDSNKLSGWAFRRDSLIANPLGAGVGSLAIPCHEVFITDGSTTNELTIVDMDTADGLNINAGGFTGFCSTNGNIAPETTSLGTQPATWYFRGKKSTVLPSSYELMGEGSEINYMFNDASGNLIGGNFWDDATTSALSKKVKFDEAFIGSKVATAGIIDAGLDTEREVLFSSFDNYISYFHTSATARSNAIWSSDRQLFKIDDVEVDPIIDLFDFTGLNVYDAITRLAWAHNFVFGFDVDKFFIISKDLQEITHTLDAGNGDILDLEKTIDNEIRNIISIQPYIPQVQDVDWEITHIGDDSVLADETLFNGDLVLQVNTHREASLNLICTRKGRLIMDQYGTADDPLPEGSSWTGEVTDSISNPEDRLIPMFKFKVNAPTKNVVLMSTIGVDSTDLYLNTTFSGGVSPIQKGDIIIFSNPETFEQIGRVISIIDATNNMITIEEGVGFVVEKNTPLGIASANTGNRTTSSGNVDQRSYGTTYSDEGVCVITVVGAETINGNIHQVLTVNNINPFRGFNFTLYNTESYKHYAFLLTTMSSSEVNGAILPSGALGGSSTSTLAWVYKVDESGMKIYLNGQYSHFSVNQVLRIHYCMQPAILIKKIDGGSHEPPPYTSVMQDLPEGLASWHWACDEVTDLFNVGDRVNFKFKGIKLVKDSATIYTGANTSSMAKYGDRPWTFPDNRFVNHNKVEYWVSKFLQEYSHPRMKIKATLPFNEDISFMTPAGNLLRTIRIVDEVMFPGISSFSVTGYLLKLSINLKTFKMNIEFRTEEQY
jgi:hypothetical protein